MIHSNGSICADDVVGVDVSKNHLDVALADKVERIENRRETISALAERLKKQGVVRVGLEPSGGYERLAVAVFREAGLTPILVDSWRVRQFAKSRGQRAKSDPLDARLIREFMVREAESLRPWPDPGENQVRLTAWVREATRADAALLALKARREAVAAQDVRAVIDGEIAAVNATIKAAEKAIAERIAGEPEMARKQGILDSVPGVGVKTIRVLLAEMPELGTLESGKAAALAGLAPYQRQSGKRAGKGVLEGGRHALKRAAYLMATAALRHNDRAKAIYQAFRQKGKAHKVAVIAVARRFIVILNAMVKAGAEWNGKAHENLTPTLS